MKIKRIVREIGEGGEGTCYLVEDHAGRRYVQKCIRRRPEGFPSNTPEEVKTLKKLNMAHPNIIRLIDYERAPATDRRYEHFIYYDYYQGGDLVDMIPEEEEDLLSETTLMRWFLQMAYAVAYLHHGHWPGQKPFGYAGPGDWSPIMHRDIKPANIFIVGSKIKVKDGYDIWVKKLVLGDFGLATHPSRKGLAGTTDYLPPDTHCSPEGDVFSLGATFHWLASGTSVFSEANPGRLSEDRIPQRYGREMSSLIEGCLAQRADERISVKNLVRRLEEWPSQQRARRLEAEGLGLKADGSTILPYQRRVVGSHHRQRRRDLQRMQNDDIERGKKFFTRIKFQLAPNETSVQETERSLGPYKSQVSWTQPSRTATNTRPGRTGGDLNTINEHEQTQHTTRTEIENNKYGKANYDDKWSHPVRTIVPTGKNEGTSRKTDQRLTEVSNAVRSRDSRDDHHRTRPSEKRSDNGGRRDTSYPSDSASSDWLSSDETYVGSGYAPSLGENTMRYSEIKEIKPKHMRSKYHRESKPGHNCPKRRSVQGRDHRHKDKSQSRHERHRDGDTSRKTESCATIKGSHGGNTKARRDGPTPVRSTARRETHRDSRRDGGRTSRKEKERKGQKEVTLHKTPAGTKVSAKR